MCTVYFTIVVRFLQVARGAMEAKKDAHIWDFKSLMFENHRQHRRSKAKGQQMFYKSTIFYPHSSRICNGMRNEQ